MKTPDQVRADFVHWTKERVIAAHDEAWEEEYRLMAASFACDDMEQWDRGDYHHMVLTGTAPDMSTIAGADKYFIGQAEQFMLWDSKNSVWTSELDEDEYQAVKDRVIEYLEVSTRPSN